MKIKPIEAWATVVKSSETRGSLTYAVAGTKKELLKKYHLDARPWAIAVKVTIVPGWKRS